MSAQRVRRILKSELTVAETGARGKSLLGIILSIIVLMVISSMIVAAIVIINPEIANFTNKQHASREAITLEESMLGELTAKRPDFRWLPARSWSARGDNINDNESVDQLLLGDGKSLNLITMPPSERRRSSSLPTLSNNQQHHQNFQLNTTILISNTSLLSSIDYQGCKLSPSRRYLLIWTHRKKQFRHSFTAKYFIYDIELDLISSLSTSSQQTGNATSNSSSLDTKQQHNQFDQLDSASLYLNDHFNLEDNPEDHTRFQIVDWVDSDTRDGQQPDRQRSPSDSLILVQNNDIYLLQNVSQLGSSTSPQAQTILPKRLTFTGKFNEIFNGVSDWLYEEEILIDTAAMDLSPTGSRLAYLSFNDSLVDSIPFPIYSDLIIPKIQTIKYPRTGRPNPLVSVHIIDSLLKDSERQDIKLNLPKDLEHQQHYIPRINWLTDNSLGLIWTTRSQDEAYVLICSRTNNWKCEKNLQIKAEGGWLDISDDLYPLDDDHYLALLPKFEGPEVGNFKHLAKVSLTKPDDVVFLTSGRKDVTSVNRVDSKRSLVYYTSTVINEPGQRQLFVAELVSGAISAGAGLQHPSDASFEARSSQQTHERQQARLDKPPGISVCITCDHYPAECLYNSAQVSPSGNYYIFNCEGPGVPRTELRATGRRRHRLLTPNRKSTVQRPAISLSEQSRGTKSSNVVAQQQAQSEPQSATDGSPVISSSVNDIAEDGSREGIDNNNKQGSDNEATGDSAPPLALGGLDGQSENLLWTFEDNKDLRRLLEQGKAMPLKMRFKVPIANTNYSANVILLLPPPLSPTANFKSIPGSASARASQTSPMNTKQLRSKRGASSRLFGGLAFGAQQEVPPLHAYYTLETIKDYISLLPAGQQYPMVVNVYGGPGSQLVDYRFNIDFGHYLASSRRTIYAMIDGRGSGYQGTKLLHEVYHRLGTVEIQDQIDVTAFLTKNFSFIDPTKVAIWGWSYGGYSAAMALAQSNAQAMQLFRARLKTMKTSLRPGQSPVELLNQLQEATTPSLAQLISARPPSSLAGLPQLHGVFECAASVAPVTNWIYYDTSYTERFMSSPWRNELYDHNMVDDHRKQQQQSAEPTGPLAVASKQQPWQPDQQQSRDPQTINPNRWISLNETLPPGPLSRVSVMPESNEAQAQSFIKRFGAINNPSDDLNDRYRRASLLEHIGDIDRRRFLLVHGTADDNVHFQQSIMLMKRLIQKNVLFETRLYPDQDHGIANRADKLHLGSTLSSFFAECFDMAY